MSIYLLYTLKEVLYSNSYVQNILQTDNSTIICMIFVLNKNTIQNLRIYYKRYCTVLSKVILTAKK
jgi:hypothetical protein